MSEAVEKLMTVAEFLAWEGEWNVRYELIDGAPVAMNPPLGSHRAIVGNAAREIGIRLRKKRPCRAELEAGIAISDKDYFVADIGVTCAPPRNGQDIDDPVLLVEVLSRTTRTKDLGRKLPAYQAIDSVQEIWILESERRWLQLWRRQGASRWAVESFLGSATFESAVLGSDVGLDDLYMNTAIELGDGEDPAAEI